MSSAKRKAWKNKQRYERLMALRAALSMEYDGNPPPGFMKLNCTRTAYELETKRRRDKWAEESPPITGRFSSGWTPAFQSLPKSSV